MSSVRKFLFDESFDIELPHHRRKAAAAPEPEPEPEPPPEPAPPPPPPPTFSEAELEAARKQAHADGEKAGRSAGYGQGYGEGHVAGRKEGVEQARREVEAQVAARCTAALEKIAAGVDALIADRAAGAAARRDEPVLIALAIVRKLMPELARRHGLAEVEALVRSCLAELIDEPRLVVRVAPDMADPVREELDALSGARGFGARLMVVDEPALGRGDCRIEWAEGGAERDIARTLNEIETIAARLMEAPVPA